MTAMLFSLG